MICVVDYGVGNIQAFLNLFKRLGVEAQRASKPDDMSNAVRLVLPGVGHFDHAMQQLNESGLRPELERRVLGAQVPILGICVGMQMLAHSSEEGSLPGFGWIPGRVLSFASQRQSASCPITHMGWNHLQPKPGSRLFSKGFEGGAEFYFLHSFFFDAEDKKDVAATASHCLEFDAVVSRGHIHGVQCHPEKSHHWGEQLLKNFLDL